MTFRVGFSVTLAVLHLSNSFETFWAGSGTNLSFFAIFDLMKRERCSCLLLASTGAVCVIMRHNRSVQVFKLLNAAQQCCSSLSELLQHHQCNSMQWSQSKKRNNKTNATIIIRRSVPNSLDVLVLWHRLPSDYSFSSALSNICYLRFLDTLCSWVFSGPKIRIQLQAAFVFFGWITCCKRKVKGSGFTLYMNWLNKFADTREKIGGATGECF